MNSDFEEKIESARKELLDMGLRGNTLLHFKSGSKNLEIVDEKSTEIYKILVDQQKSMTFLPLPEELYKEEEDNENIGTFTLPKLLEEKHGSSRFTDTKLQTKLKPDKLDKKLILISNEASTYAQEQGIDLLYIALGFLLWKEEGSSAYRKAPLVLIPVILERRNAGERFKVTYTGGDLGPNLTLNSKLKMDFQLTLPIFPEELEINSYFDEIKKAIIKKSDWKVVQDEIALGFFSFGKFRMYQDLSSKAWPESKQPGNHPILRGILGDGFSLQNNFVVPKLENYQLNFVKDADETQTEAILKIKSGINIVIQGPPGTGKSQTITNIISEALADGKKILFVAEKMAALEVVKRRLDECHLGDTILELHSQKSNKKAVLGELSRVLELGKPILKSRSNEIKRYIETKEYLDKYCEDAENTILNTGYNMILALGEYLNLKKQIGDKQLPMDSFENKKTWNNEKYKEACRLLQNTIDYIKNIGSQTNNPFVKSTITEFTPIHQNELKIKLSEMIEKIQNLRKDVGTLEQDLGEPNLRFQNSIDLIQPKLEIIKNAPYFKEIEVLHEDWERKLDTCREFFNSLLQIQEEKTKFQDIIKDSAYMYDTQFLEDVFSKIEQSWNPLFSGQNKYLQGKDLGEIKNSILELKEILLSIQSDADSIQEKLSLNKNYYLSDEILFNEYLNIIHFFNSIDKWNHGNEAWENHSEIESIFSIIEELQSIKKNSIVSIKEDVWHKDIKLTKNIYNSIGKKWWKILSSTFRKERKNLISFLENSSNIDHDSSYVLLDQIAEYQLKFEKFKLIEKNISYLFGTDWQESKLENISLKSKYIQYKEILGKISKSEIPKYFKEISKDKFKRESLLNILNSILSKLSKTNSIYSKLFQQISTQKVFENKEIYEIEMKQLITIMDEWIHNIEISNTTWNSFSSHIEHNENFPELSKVKEYLVHLNSVKTKQEIGKQNLKEISHLFKDSADETIEKYLPLKDEVFHFIEVQEKVNSGYLTSNYKKFLKQQDERNNLLQKNESIRKSYKEIQTLFNDILISLKLDYFNLKSTSFSLSDLNDLLEEVSFWKENLNDISKIANWNRILNSLQEEGLHFYSDLVRFSKLEPDHILYVLQESWLLGIIKEGFSKIESFKNFDRLILESKLQEFKQLDLSLLSFTQEELALKHFDTIPRTGLEIGEVGIILKEINKKKRQTPIRKLISQATRVIQKIKPVFMMSPMSIATYLEPGAIDFDLVIFDEASQVKVVDALGAIIRGKQIVVVGDTKQMPPSNFFSKSLELEDEEAEESQTADVESILGMFLSKGVQESMLKWHYRSRHESLITTSNESFYGNKLKVFPSSGSDKNATGLKLKYLPDTMYDRGNSRTNEGEAEAVAKDVMQHAKISPHLSLGVVAFSTAQRDAILFQLEKLRRLDPSLEDFFSNQTSESFFVKNLENVQGDERDVIFISLGYGKTTSGKTTANFGPLNKSGGERRLNVLITRAKNSMVVYSNFKYDELKILDTSSEGLRTLQKFLEYADSQTNEKKKVSDTKELHPFETYLKESIEKLGYDVVCKVGTAGFFVDIAVLDKKDKNKYILGIETDGMGYYSIKSIRDRERLKSSVLESLGWKIHKIWCTDFLRDPELELQRLREKLEVKNITEKVKQKESKNTDNVIPISIQRETLKNSAKPNQVYPLYQFCSSKLGIPLTEDLHNIDVKVICEAIKKVILVENPIHKLELYKRITDSVGVSKAGSRITAQIDLAIKFGNNTQLFFYENPFLFQDSKKEVQVRDRSNLPATNKKIDYISNEEIILAIIEILKIAESIQVDDLKSETLKILGFQKITDNSSERLDSILKNLIATERIILKEGIIYNKENK
jgi:hypothetical protein